MSKTNHMDKGNNILVFNCGSSSLKYRLINMPSEKELSSGEAQRIGPPTSEPARIYHRENGKEEVFYADMQSHESAFLEVLKILSAKNTPVDAIGHRVVHGGNYFKAHTLIDLDVIEMLKKTAGIAPIHNPPAIALIEACYKNFPGIKQVAVFDTAYHSTIPNYAKTYSLPKTVTRRLGIRKYGFHGTSHKYVASEAAKMLNIPLKKLNAVSCHLGSGGASLCAIVKGKSVDNTMGYSPLPGLVMSTRSGDIDSMLALQLTSQPGGDFKKLENILNKKSGVLGMSGISGDIRDIIKAHGSSHNNVRIENTLQVYLWRIRKALGAYLAVVGNPDAVIFTDTIGETIPEVRQAVCSGMDAFGIQIDALKNGSCGSLPADITSRKSKVKLLVIATNEELEIARETNKLTIVH